MTLPDPDRQTHERLLIEPLAGPAILSAVVAMLIGSNDAQTAARILREWADEIEQPTARLQ